MPSQKTIVVHCAKCDHEWRPLLPMPMTLDRAMTVLRGIAAAGCPSCGAHGNDVLVGQVSRTCPRLAMSQAQGI